MLDDVPIWGVFVITTVLLVVAKELGFRPAQVRVPANSLPQLPDGAGPVILGATIGLLGFILAFTFGIAATRFDNRRQLVLEEANAIGTTFLRAELLGDPAGAASRKLLRQYLDLRLQSVTAANLAQILKESSDLHVALWRLAAGVARKEPNALPVSLYIQSLNDLIDLHEKRLELGLHARIPATIWLVLFLAAMLTMGGYGYLVGQGGQRRSLTGMAFITTFALVVQLIADLDRPGEGWLQTSRAPFRDLREAIDPAPTK